MTQLLSRREEEHNRVKSEQLYNERYPAHRVIHGRPNVLTLTGYCRNGQKVPLNVPPPLFFLQLLTDKLVSTPFLPIFQSPMTRLIRCLQKCLFDIFRFHSLTFSTFCLQWYFQCDEFHLVCESFNSFQ
ncbi:hypothetical protein PHET_00030 [Paragonimus heterotremus]|uniref:Uncharacterized protein n=1 Tax=Paragonimus heterotremus TaxID=100268 RepID=A0A8J4TP69_9TREM|nr:hypothetical protein PHET_00030 [Paragonimus heterotremus]